MKKILLASLFGISFFAGRAQITLDSSNFVFTTSPRSFFSAVVPENVPSPAPGMGVNWTYDNVPINPASPPRSAIYNTLYPQFSSNALVDTGYFEPLPGGQGIIYDNILENTPTGIQVSGYVVHEKRVSLMSQTGNPSDSLIIPSNSYTLSDPVVIMEYPGTVGTVINNEYIQSFEGILTWSGGGFFNAPIEKRYRYNHVDSIIGYGNMTVPNGSGGGSTFPVLMVRRRVVRQDSIFVNGMEAPMLLLFAFNVQQGQITRFYQTVFYRMGTSSPLMAIDYWNDSTFTTPYYIQFDAQNVATSTDKVLNGSTVLVFPNPSNGQVHINIANNNPEECTFIIRTMDGKEITRKQFQRSEFVSETVELDLPNGLYFYQVQN
ncbi:MAG: T9SS type A sorting domain-containing protein, partial [Bacteroidia bacterium]|nr:T9SS type A sorting domain-containing protein [Bacteroidia bacterium]